jgi:short-subunit dehydrogenase
MARMKARRKGQIALMSSLAAYTPLPAIAGYAATKAAVKNFGEGLRMELRPHGIGVTVICPGYVRSRLTENGPAFQPFVLEAEAAAALIKRRLARDPTIIAFPWPLHVLSWAIGALPARLRQPILGLAVPGE